MIKVIPASHRHFNDFGWLQTYWLFSFAEYYDPENIQLGALRAFNDDVVMPRTASRPMPIWKWRSERNRQVGGPTPLAGSICSTS